jgi:antitoxin component YwqK of YwqJK toxin-antitoxin module
MAFTEHLERYRNRFRMTLYKIILITVTVFTAVSCGDRNNHAAKIKMPKQVPDDYYRTSDPAFSNHQDTVFYMNRHFSGVVYDLFPSGDTAMRMGYFNGLREGISIKWYPNKQVDEERLYVDGRKEGIHRGWWESGKPKFTFDVSNDEYTGRFREWYVAGNICRDFYYKNGQEEGNEKMWWPDGTIRANYVIKNGQKFGLFGQRLCANNTSKPQ